MFTGVPIDVIRQWRSRSDATRIIAAGFLDGPQMLSAGPPPPGAFAVATARMERAPVVTGDPEILSLPRDVVRIRRLQR